MLPRDALNQTMRTFHIKAKDICQAAGLAESYLSRYRNSTGD